MNVGGNFTFLIWQRSKLTMNKVAEPSHDAFVSITEQTWGSNSQETSIFCYILIYLAI